MSHFSERQRIIKSLQSFRFVTASAILRNIDHIDHLSANMHHADHIGELCDQYALKVLIEWLAIKHDFPVYAELIDHDDPKVELSSAQAPGISQTWIQLTNAYPIGSELEQIASDNQRNSIRKEAFECLESGSFGALPVSLELLGTLYEVFSSAPLNISLAGEIYIQKSSKRKLLGQFYTPPWVVHYCYDIAFKKDLNKFISANKSGSKDSLGGKSTFCEPLKILDPACGGGNFLIGAASWFAKNLNHADLYTLIKDSLFGIEIDGAAAVLCRIALVLSAAKYIKQVARVDGDQVASKLVFELVQSLNRHIVVGDSLITGFVINSLDSLGDCDQRDENHSWLLSGESFDLVVTNPPYISYGSRNQIRLNDDWQKCLKAVFPNSAEYKIRLHSIFQEIAVRYVKPDGNVVLFLPDAFLTGRYYEKLRQLLLRECRIESLTELPEATMAEAVVGRWCVANYRKKENKNGNRSSAQNEDLDYSVDVLSLNPARKYQLPINHLVSKDRSRFRLTFNEIDHGIWQTVDELEPLGSVLCGHTGIRAKIGQLGIIADRKRGINWKKGITSGGQVSRHQVDWKGDWLNIDSQLLFAGGHDPHIVEKAKILVRQTADRVVAALDLDSLYHLNNVHAFNLRQSVKLPSNQSTFANNSESKSLQQHGSLQDYAGLQYFEGLMNSSFWLYLYQLKSRESERALAQIDIEMLESMPIPKMDKAEQAQAIVSLVARLHDKNKIKDDMSSFLIERAIDRLVYDLYNLNNQQVLHIESSCLPKLAYSGKLPTRSEALKLAESFLLRKVNV
jgi:type I restriction-modification system DNA methylase subunit